MLHVVILKGVCVGGHIFFGPCRSTASPFVNIVLPQIPNTQPLFDEASLHGCKMAIRRLRAECRLAPININKISQG